MRLAWIDFRNYKSLRNCRLPLERITVLVGPNGAGKSTVLEALKRIADLCPKPGAPPALLRATGSVEEFINVDARKAGESTVEIRCGMSGPDSPVFALRWWPERPGSPLHNLSLAGGMAVGDRPPGKEEPVPPEVAQRLGKVRIFAFDPGAIAQPCQVQARVELESTGKNLAAVLDGLRDEHPELFEAVNEALPAWLPEFDRILFERPSGGQKSVALRTRQGGYMIPAKALSHGTLIALCLLTLAHLPDPPRIIGLEEPGRGLHPRLLGQVHDALVRLAYPEQYGIEREPAQIIATTHSPYFLDLFKDHPEHVVVANKEGLEVRFEPLAGRPELQEQLSQTALGEIWYSGVLGGVPGTSCR
ncbi:MAG TPA: hypothetical protein EYP56_02780 [Planctomycetaceae bacterium]|nr:hypothetical protein [Planctomycetaceae bacterium]HIQ22989.1 hypothetical protein [Planctomycetota bacterium]